MRKNRRNNISWSKEGGKEVEGVGKKKMGEEEDELVGKKKEKTRTRNRQERKRRMNWKNKLRKTGKKSKRMSV
jgi:hypothetical protein